MARPAASPATRLRILEKSLEKAKKLPRGSSLTAKPMSELLAVSWSTLNQWCEEIPGFATSGTFDRGARGIEWNFRPVPCIRFLIKHFEAETKRLAAHASRQRKVVGAPAADEAAIDLSIDELGKLLRLSLDFQDAKLRTGELVKVSIVGAALRKCFSGMQQAGVQTLQELDPGGAWSVEQREIAENVARTMLLKQRRSADTCLTEIGQEL